MSQQSAPPDVTLRSARRGDAELLLAWRNDPATRAASLDSEPIPLETHLAWLERKLADERTVLLIVEESGRPAGQVRLEREDNAPDTAEIHIGLDPAARGRAIGRTALTAAARLAETLGIRRIRAVVREENEPSLRAFRAAGFTVVSTGGGLVQLVRESV